MLKNLFILMLIAGISINAFSQEKKELDQEKKQPDFESFDITKVGQDAPDFSFTTIEGKTYKLSELRGKTVLVVFFATWCAPCMKELPLIEKEIWNEYKSRDNFTMIALGREHSMDEIKKFNEKKGFTFPLGPDPERKIYSKYFSYYIPRNVVISKEGKIIFQKQGYREVDAKNLVKLIDQETR